MNTGLRTCRRISGLPQAALLVPLLLLAPVAHAQAAAQAGAQPVPDQPDLDPNLAPMPDIGVDWPDMGQPDIVTPMVELPPQSSDVPQQAVAPEAAEEQAEEAVTFADTGADAGEERRYTVAMTGVEEIADAQFTTRFNELSVLHQGEGKPANLAQINRRIKEDSDLLDRLLRAKGYYAARIRGAVTPRRRAATGWRSPSGSCRARAICCRPST